MSKKKYANTTVEKSTDNEGNFLVNTAGCTATFHKEGVMVSNDNNGVITWNSGDITHINVTDHELCMMYDAETGLITLTDNETDKNIWINIEWLKDIIHKDGMLIDEAEDLLRKEKEEDERKRESGESESGIRDSEGTEDKESV